MMTGKRVRLVSLRVGIRRALRGPQRGGFQRDHNVYRLTAL